MELYFVLYSVLYLLGLYHVTMQLSNNINSFENIFSLLGGLTQLPFLYITFKVLFQGGY